MSSINSMIEQIETVETAAELDYLQDRIDAEIDEQAEVGSYPRFGYTTAQVFETAEEWADWKKAELSDAIIARRAELEKTSAGSIKYYAQPLWELTPAEFEQVEEISINTSTNWGWDEETNVTIVQPIGYTLTAADYARIEEVMHS